MMGKAIHCQDGFLIYLPSYLVPCQVYFILKYYISITAWKRIAYILCVNVQGTDSKNKQFLLSHAHAVWQSSNEETFLLKVSISKNALFNKINQYNDG